MVLSPETASKGAVLHHDPDHLIALSLGYHPYTTVNDAKSAYVTNAISHLEFEAILDHILPVEEPHLNNPALLWEQV